MLLSTRTHTPTARAIWGIHKKVAFGVVTNSHSDEQRTLSYTLSGSTLGSNEATDSNFGSVGATHLEEPARHTSSDQAHSLESTLAPQYVIRALVPCEPNWWCVDSQYKIYKDTRY